MQKSRMNQIHIVLKEFAEKNETELAVFLSSISIVLARRVHDHYYLFEYVVVTLLFGIIQEVYSVY